MTCPSYAGGYTTKGKATGIVPWKIEVTDNSVIVDPNAKITVNSSHQPSAEFPIGETGVQVTASDSAGNVASCFFHVTVKG